MPQALSMRARAVPLSAPRLHWQLCTLRSRRVGLRPLSSTNSPGTQYAPEAYLRVLGEHGLIGLPHRRRNSFDNAKKAESLMKTIKVRGGRAL